MVPVSLLIYGDTVPVLPLTVVQYKAVTALFKASDYRSYANYASNIKGAHVEPGFAWSEQLAQAATWCRRSVERGMGPPRQSAPFKLDRVLTLDRTASPLVPDGPQHPVHLLLLSSMFMLREIEVAGTCLSHVTFDHTAKEVSWLLPASKTDSTALGVTRC